MCKACSGKKVIRERQILEVHIDKGNWLGCFIIPGMFF
jgi:DnaJ-class molecular chaperone